MKRIGFLGAGNMATAIVKGILESGVLPPGEIAAADIDPVKREQFSKMGIWTSADLSDVCRESQILLFAVKPQNMGQVLSGIRESYRPDHLLVSIAAGISADYISRSLGSPDAKIILAMPNTPMLVGHGAIALSRASAVSGEDFTFIKTIFSAAGHVEEIPASKMSQVIPVNGSSPAFLYLFAKTVADYARQEGIPWEAAYRLFCHTMIGSAEMMLQSNATPQELIDMVCSPGGTTLEAMEGLEETGFAASVREACRRCIQRAFELGK